MVAWLGNLSSEFVEAPLSTTIYTDEFRPRKRPEPVVTLIRKQSRTIGGLCADLIVMKDMPFQDVSVMFYAYTELKSQAMTGDRRQSQLHCSLHSRRRRNELRLDEIPELRVSAHELGRAPDSDSIATRPGPREITKNHIGDENGAIG
jgi:hypothetical protein